MRTLEERFWAKVDKSDGCWNWTGAKSSGGYGSINISGAIKIAHRVSWSMVNGPIPSGDHHGTMCILHKCDNTLCVRPDHLVLGTQKENMADMVSKDRSLKGVSINIGSTHGLAKLTEGAVKQIRKYYAPGGCTQKWLAQVYGVSRQTIGVITRNEYWSHV